MGVIAITGSLPPSAFNCKPQSLHPSLHFTAINIDPSTLRTGLHPTVKQGCFIQSGKYIRYRV